MKNISLFYLILVLLSVYIPSASAQDVTLNIYSNQTEIKARGRIILGPGFHVPAGRNLRVFIEQSVPIADFAGLPSNDKNYVSTRTYKVPGVNSSNINDLRKAADLNQGIQYLDGLGRPLQTIVTQGSPSFKDVVQPVVYDDFGREAIKYLPYAAQTGTNGSYRSGAATDVIGFYNNPTPGVVATAYPYSETVFEPSPLNKVQQQGAPGTAWQVAQGHTMKSESGTNAGTQEVKLWIVTGDGASTGSFYPAGTLYKTTVWDENTLVSVKAGSVEEYKDLEGKVILKRTWETESKSLSTYYVYDDLKNLRYVLPPAVNENGQSSVNSFTEAQSVFEQFIYGYHYDARRRISEKKIPGKGWEYLLYNKLDQLVLSQDANQHAKSPLEWSFVKYDGLGRVVVSGLYHSNEERSTLQAGIDGSARLWELSQTTGSGYSNIAFPQSGADNLQYSYYDDYSFPGGSTYTFSGASSKTKGLLTGRSTKVLGTNDALLSINYYDDEARVIKAYSQHYLGGVINAAKNYDEISNTYSFAGELMTSTRIHHANDNTVTVFTRNEYDHQGRLANSYENINNQGEVLLNSNTYNEIGQLQQKQLAGGLQRTTYSYNERGWLKSLKSNEFSESLSYEDGNAPQWNGNIARQTWGKADNLPNVFSYDYDKLNRLTGSASTGIVMSESLGYDEMGNIKRLSRDAGTEGVYNYNGNQLSSISNGPLATGSYGYDVNGNAITDGRNGVTLTYNYLNLPQTASRAATSGRTALNMNYTYDAAGTKLRKESNTGGTTDYIGGIQYQNGVIEFIQTEEGVARNNAGTYSYEYNLNDHLGNVRYTFNKDPNTGGIQRLQEDNYYAFGLRKAVLGGPNKYLYNKKELQEELEVFDYGARFYDPVIGRWNVIDPITDLRPNISPYTYCVNNPILYIDKFGLDSLNAIHYLKEVVIRGYKAVSVMSPLFPQLDRPLKMFTDWTDQKRNKYPAENFTDLAYNATRRNAQTSVVKGDLLNRVKNDPAFKAWRKQIIAQYRLNPLINKISQPLKLGGNKFFSLDGDTELKLSIRGAVINANFVESNGTTTLNYGIDDVFDIRQQGGRGLLYNGINGFLEPIWVDVFHGNEDMKVEVRWNETVTK